MNFLAHLYLSGSDTKIMVGNFLGDFVRGRNLIERFEPQVVLGIQLHRAIDVYTDSHAIVTESKNRLRAKYRHYSPVIVDMFYDHFLAKNWNNHHDESLSDFAQYAYKIITHSKDIMPDDAQGMLPYMINGNWLVNYAQLKGIAQALQGMSRRTKFDSKMDEAIDDLSANYNEFEKEFEAFFPQLKNFSNAFLNSNNK